ncbi:MAG: energy transducer TonB [Candidatus Sulfotelmatobacter sp.]
MLEQKSLTPSPRRGPLADPQERSAFDRKQRGLMIGALCLLLLALGIVLWHDRDFWFPEAQDAESDEVESSPVASATPLAQPPAVANVTREAVPATKPKHHSLPQTRLATSDSSPAQEPGAGAVITRTVLPPLEVEVIAGDTHRTLRPGSSSVHVDLQPGMPPRPAAEPTSTIATDRPENLPSDAAERVQMSVDTSEVVARPVKPSYPLLARQMKVQGSVILQALVGKDGVIQNLRVVSGPPILATAAQDAVRQWHFRPHLEGNEAVETQAKITVNFTISTN